MLAVASAIAPGSCVGNVEWSATTAASGQSVLSGVLAGFVFGGIVVVLSVRPARRREEAAKALKLLFCAFFGLTVAAYLLAAQAADTECLRAGSEEVISGGLLGTFAIVMIVSLTWLIVAYDVHAHGVLRFLRRLIYFASAFVVLLLCTSSYSYLQREVPNGPSNLAGILIYAVGALVYLIAAGAVAATRLRVLPVRSSVNRQSDPSAATRPSRHGAVDRCAWVALAYLAVAAIGDAFVLSLSDAAWAAPQLPAVYALAWSSLVLPLVVVVVALGALAPELAVSDNTGQESPDTPFDHGKGLVFAASADQDRPDRLLDSLASLAVAWVVAYGLVRIGRRRRGVKAAAQAQDST